MGTTLDHHSGPQLGDSLQEREVNPVNSGSKHSHSRLRERESEHRKRIKDLSGQLQRLEAQSDGYRLEIEKMAQIN
ncbi:hypothetical protein L211DRAFT_866105, partial [Terfezia boudieri ATCC MYA-4762]